MQTTSKRNETVVSVLLPLLQSGEQMTRCVAVKNIHTQCPTRIHTCIHTDIWFVRFAGDAVECIGVCTASRCSHVTCEHTYITLCVCMYINFVLVPTYVERNLYIYKYTVICCVVIYLFLAVTPPDPVYLFNAKFYNIRWQVAAVAKLVASVPHSTEYVIK